MVQNQIERKTQIAEARKAHHAAQIKDKKRLDAYIQPETKEGLKLIKARYADVKNEGQAVDRAVELALSIIG